MILATLSIWDVIGPMTAVMVAVCTISGFIIRLMISNAVIRLEGKIDAINISGVMREVDALWAAQKETAASLVKNRHDLENDVNAIKLRLAMMGSERN